MRAHLRLVRRRVVSKPNRQVSKQIDAAEDAEALYAMDIAGTFQEALNSTNREPKPAHKRAKVFDSKCSTTVT